MGECKPAYMSTKVTVHPKDLRLDTEYQRGLGWMRRIESESPCKKTFSQPPEEEIRKDMPAISCNALVAKKSPNLKEMEDDPFASSNVALDRLQ